MQNSVKYLAIFAAIVASGFLFSVPQSNAQIADGDLVTTSRHPNVYIVKIVGQNMYKRLILNPEIFNQYEHLKWENIKTVGEVEFGKYKLSKLARMDGDYKVFELWGDGDTGTKRWLNLTPEEFENAGYDWNSIYIMNRHEHDSYPLEEEYNTQNLPVREFGHGIIPGISSTSDIDKLQELGVDIVRLHPDDLSFTKNALQGRGIKIMVQKVDAKPNNLDGVPPPASYSQWAQELKQLVGQHPDIKYWQVWNEPNEILYWYPTPSAARYVELLKVSYTAIKEANPNAVVITAGLSGVNPPRQYLRDMYAAGAGEYFDVLALHPYRQPNSPDVYLKDYLLFMKNIMETYGDLEKDIWITEIGWPTKEGEFGAVTEAEQAEFLRRTYEIAFELDFIKAVFWYRLQDAGEGMGILGRPAEDEYRQLAN